MNQRKSNERVLMKFRNNIFTRAMDDIALRRVKENIDIRTRPRTQIAEAIARGLLSESLDSFKAVKKDLIRGKFPQDKRGQFSQLSLFTFIVVAFIAVVLFGGLIYVMGLLNGTFQQIGISNEVNSGNAGYVNMTQASDNTFGKLNDSTQGLRLVALTLIFSMILGTMLANALMKVHPAFFFVYILIVVLAVIFAAPVANSYETLLQSGIYGGLLVSFSGSNWVLLHLPLVVAITGVMGSIFLFINIVRVGNEGILS